MLQDELTKILNESFKKLNLGDYGVVTNSKRKEICQFQCNDLFKCSKENNKKPEEIAELIIEDLKENKKIKKIEFSMPGFLNIDVEDEFITQMLEKVLEKNESEKKETYVMDYCGPNIAKPLHVGHLRSAVIGESVKRIIKYKGHKVIADAHLGDYGLQMGQVIYGLTDEGIEENFTIDDLDRIYPMMSAKCKEDENLLKIVRNITRDLQNGNEEYRKIWEKIVEVSLNDLKPIYEKLGISLDYWYGESDGASYIDKVLREFKDVSRIDDGALVIDVKEETDKAEMPPLILQNTNKSFGYGATDLGTILQRKEDFNPDNILYVVDIRQSLHFKQVFRAAKKFTNTNLELVGFGTVNGKDGKPFKTRDGGVVKLNDLINDAIKALENNREENKNMEEEDKLKLVNAVLKFGDMQTLREKNYVFDIDKFASYEGKTGPSIVYSVVRVRKLLANINNFKLSKKIENKQERELRLKLLEMDKYIDLAFTNRSPHFLCEYAYDVSTLVNSFYQSNYILNNDDEETKASWAELLRLSSLVLERVLYLLGIEIPERM